MLFYRYLNLKNYVSRETLIHNLCGKCIKINLINKYVYKNPQK